MIDDYELGKSPIGIGWIYAYKIRPSESPEKFRKDISKRFDRTVGHRKKV